MKAEELRAAALAMNDRDCRAMLLQIARDYENIAGAAETRAHATSTVCAIDPGHESKRRALTTLIVSVPRSRREAS